MKLAVCHIGHSTVGTQGRIQTSATDANASVKFPWGRIPYCLHRSDSDDFIIISISIIINTQRLATYHYQLEPKVTHKHTSYRFNTDRSLLLASIL